MNTQMNPSPPKKWHEKPIIVVPLFIIAVIIIGLFAIKQAERSTTQSTQTVSSQTPMQIPTSNQAANIRGNLNAELIGKKLILSLNSNIVDGCKLNINILCDNEISDQIIISNGQFRKEYYLKEISPGYIYVRAIFEFEKIKTEQPQNVQNIYGINGEKITGNIVKMFKNGEKYCAFESEIPYPNLETATRIKNKEFDDEIDGIIKRSKGFVVYIAPLSKKTGWTFVKVILSDDWYSHRQYEQERYISSISGEIEFIVRDVYNKSNMVSIHYYDQYGKELASPKLVGSGYKIKK